MELSAAQILGMRQPEELFPRQEVVSERYRELVKLWHPDVNKTEQARDVFLHIGVLRKRATDKIQDNTWNLKNTYATTLKNGKIFRAPSYMHFDFELGTTHISPTTLTFEIDRKDSDLFQRAVNIFSELKFGDFKMEEVYVQTLPVKRKIYESDKTFLLTVKKYSDSIRLRDLLQKIPMTDYNAHIVWIFSRLHEMVRYLDFVGIAHNDISLDTVYVSPSTHKISILGGWWYAAKFGERLHALPGYAMQSLPDDGKATGAIDREQIRDLMRRMMQRRIYPIAPPIEEYVKIPSTGDSQKDLDLWYSLVLRKSYGKRVFTKLDLKFSDVYKGEV